MVPFLLVWAPGFAQWLAYITSERAVHEQVDATGGISAGFHQCFGSDGAGVLGCSAQAIGAAFSAPNAADAGAAARFLLCFMVLALVLDVGLPGRIEKGPETATGHVPHYVDNAVAHCVVFTTVFVALSNFGAGLFDFGVFFDVYPASIALLNVFGMLLAVFLYIKGLYFPSTADAGSSGSLLKDFTWGTELYPRVFGIDIKRFVNCRFSMTYWMLSGLSFTYASYKRHGALDWGLALGAMSQFIYLAKFFVWEIGYMRSIDIIVDRAGWEIQWGCLVWVPTVYTLHSRFLVLHPSGLGPAAACAIAGVGLLAVALNYWADQQRQHFRAHFTPGDRGYKIWGAEVRYIEAEYKVVGSDGRATTRKSLLLTSGFWGVARHFQYLFELVAAWSWTLLANPSKNGALVLFYSVFLTILLTERAVRDHKKCQLKYGKYWSEYCRRVPYKIVPGLY
eukprot:g631.t1